MGRAPCLRFYSTVYPAYLTPHFHRPPLVLAHEWYRKWSLTAILRPFIRPRPVDILQRHVIYWIWRTTSRYPPHLILIDNQIRWKFSYNPIPDIMIATKLCTSYGSWTVVACAVFQRPRTWWCHQMETFSALLALSARGLPVKFPSQRPVTRSFDVFLDLRPHKGTSKQSWGWWFETPSRALRRCCNVITIDNVLAKTVSGVAKLINRYIFCVYVGKKRYEIEDNDYIFYH